MTGKLYLQHLLFPDIVTLIRDENSTDQYFEVMINPALQQVSFKGITLRIEGNTLHMPVNYFLPFENTRFVQTDTGDAPDY